MTVQLYDWNDEAVENLKQLWADGFSAGEIARAMGPYLSRSAVIGKAHRLGLARRSSWGHRLPAPKKIRIEIKDRVVELSPRKKKMAVDVAPHPEPLRLESGALIDMESLGKGHCRWPHGDPVEPGFHFCGLQQLPENPYCEFHHARKVRHVANKRGGDSSNMGRTEQGQFTRIWG